MYWKIIFYQISIVLVICIGNSLYTYIRTCVYMRGSFYIASRYLCYRRGQVQGRNFIDARLYKCSLPTGFSYVQQRGFNLVRFLSGGAFFLMKRDHLTGFLRSRISFYEESIALVSRTFLLQRHSKEIFKGNMIYTIYSKTQHPLSQLF